MNAKLLVLGICVAVGGAASIGQEEVFSPIPRNALDDFIMAIINYFKDIVVDGNPCLGIPPLDPLMIPGLPLNIDTQLFKMRGGISDVEAAGLRNLEVKSLSCNIITLAVDLVMEMPSFSVGGNYAVDGMALLIFPIYGDGPFSVNISNFKIEGKGQLAARLNGTLYMKELDFTMQIGDMAIRFEGLLGGGDLGDVINELVNMLGLAVYDGVRAILHSTLMDVLTQLVNFSLKDITLADIIGGIIKPPPPDSACGPTTVSFMHLQ